MKTDQGFLPLPSGSQTWSAGTFPIEFDVFPSKTHTHLVFDDLLMTPKGISHIC